MTYHAVTNQPCLLFAAAADNMHVGDDGWGSMSIKSSLSLLHSYTHSPKVQRPTTWENITRLLLINRKATAEVMASSRLQVVVSKTSLDLC